MWSQRSHHQSVVCALVLIFVNIPGAWTQNNGVPQSPCPDVFNYVTDDGYEYYGWGQLYNLPIGREIVLVAKIVAPAQMINNYHGSIGLVGEIKDIARKINLKQPVNFQILFPIQNPLPVISTITVNNYVVCENSYLPRYRFTSVLTLQESLKPVVTPNFRTNLIPNPLLVSIIDDNHRNDFPNIENDFPTATRSYPQSQPNNEFTFNPPISGFPYSGNPNPNVWPDENFRPRTSSSVFPRTTEEPYRNVVPDRNFRPMTSSSIFIAPTTDNPIITEEPSRTSEEPPTSTEEPPAMTTNLTGEPPTTTKTTPPIANFSMGCGKIPILHSGMAFGGTTIDKGDWPWLVAIHTYQRSSLSFRCGGTIISNSAVLSAAHCFYRRTVLLRAQDITMFLGHHNLQELQEEGSKIIKGDSLIIHPDYKPDGKFNSDIAIVKFLKAVEFSEFIQPACLWNGSPDISEIVSKIGSFAGWGRDEHDNDYTPEPKRVRLPIVSGETCLRSHVAFANITNDRTFCGGWKNGTDGPCTGDSGSGFLLYLEKAWHIRGVVSTSMKDLSTLSCNLYEYVVFTDVAKFTDWIQSNMS